MALNGPKLCENIYRNKTQNHTLYIVTELRERYRGIGSKRSQVAPNFGEIHVKPNF